MNPDTLEFRIQSRGSGFEVRSSGLKVWGSGFSAQGLWFMVYGACFILHGSSGRDLANHADLGATHPNVEVRDRVQTLECGVQG